MPISKKPGSISELNEIPPKIEERPAIASGLTSQQERPPKRGRQSTTRRCEPSTAESQRPEVEVMAPVQRERVRLGEALRKRGIDEHAVAATYADVVEKLLGKTHESDSVEKLLVDILKECSKHLEEDAKAVADVPMRVTLVHNVARPQRPTLAAESRPDPQTENPTPAEPAQE